MSTHHNLQSASRPTAKTASTGPSGSAPAGAAPGAKRVLFSHVVIVTITRQASSQYGSVPVLTVGRGVTMPRTGEDLIKRWNTELNAPIYTVRQE